MDNIENMTASCRINDKTYVTVARGSKGKYGPQLAINIAEFEKAIKEGAYTFVNKKGEKFLSLNVKFWEPRQPAKSDAAIPTAVDNLDSHSQFDDSIPF